MFQRSYLSCVTLFRICLKHGCHEILIGPFLESSSWEPLNGFDSFVSFWVIYEFQNDQKFYWNSMGNNIFIIFSRNTQQNTTKLGTFVNVMCLQVSCAEWIKKWRKITTTTTTTIQSWPFIYKPGEHRQQSKGEKTHKITSPMSSTECEWSNFCLKLLQCTRSIGRG